MKNYFYILFCIFLVYFCHEAKGGISAMTWRTARQAQQAYTFEYDGLSRLVKSQYAVGSGSNFSTNYTEQLSYDKNGNIQTLQRYRHLPDPIDNMQYTYNGNQLLKIEDTGMPAGYPMGVTNYSYDANGNLTYEDTRTRIAYNEINLPQQVQLLGGRGIKNVYAADGRKLKSEAKQGSEYIKEGTKTYSGNLVFDVNDELDYIIFPEGRILYNVDDSTYNYEYHLKDHLGSTRVAFVPAAQSTEVVQENNYYPFGAPINDLSWSPKSTNRYLREGKEYISDFDWHKYDYSARYYDPWIIQFLHVDPLASKYYDISPYAFVTGNPIKFIDPDGKNYYSVNPYGYVSLLQNTNDVFDRLYTTNAGSIITNKDNYIDLYDRTILPGLTITRANYDGHYTTSTTKKEMFPLFYFMTNNTIVEWALSGFKNGKNEEAPMLYLLRTSHSEEYVTGPPKEFNTLDMVFNIHSHPGKSSKASGWPADKISGEFLLGSDMGVLIKRYNTFTDAGKKFPDDYPRHYIYNLESLYYYDYNNPSIFIRTINNPQDLYRGMGF